MHSQVTPRKGKQKDLLVLLLLLLLLLGNIRRASMVLP
jgi:hypothetical protein